MSNKEVLEQNWTAQSSWKIKAFTLPVPQNSSLIICQTTSRRASVLLEFELYGHNHKCCIWRGCKKVYFEKYTISSVKHEGGSQMFWTVCELQLHRELSETWWQDECSMFPENTGEHLAFTRLEAAYGMRLALPTWLWSKTQGQVDPSVAKAEKSECAGAAITLSWPQYHWATMGRTQTTSSCKTTQEFMGHGDLFFFAKNNR